MYFLYWDNLVGLNMYLLYLPFQSISNEMQCNVIDSFCYKMLYFIFRLNIKVERPNWLRRNKNYVLFWCVEDRKLRFSGIELYPIYWCGWVFYVNYTNKNERKFWKVIRTCLYSRGNFCGCIFSSLKEIFLGVYFHQTYDNLILRYSMDRENVKNLT